MRKQVKTIIAASVLTAGLLVTPIALYAREDAGGMMGGSSGHMMGGGSMMGQGPGSMMNMMGQMRQMAQNCNAMMTSMMTNHGMRPNEQWQQNAQPQAPSDQHQNR